MKAELRDRNDPLRHVVQAVWPAKPISMSKCPVLPSSVLIFKFFMWFKVAILIEEMKMSISDIVSNLSKNCACGIASETPRNCGTFTVVCTVTTRHQSLSSNGCHQVVQELDLWELDGLLNSNIVGVTSLKHSTRSTLHTLDVKKKPLEGQTTPQLLELVLWSVETSTKPATW